MVFTKNNLLENTYSWGGRKGTLDPVPTRMLFDRFSGECVLRMINLFDSLESNITVGEGQAMERWLQTELPLQTKSEITVFNWLKEKYVQNSKS